MSIILYATRKHLTVPIKGRLKEFVFGGFCFHTGKGHKVLKSNKETGEVEKGEEPRNIRKNENTVQ